MKVVAVYKWARNPVDGRVSMDGNLDWQGVKLAASEDDPAVMDIARSLAGGDEIVGLTIGDGDVSWAAARGAARSVVIEDAAAELNSLATGAVLAAAVRRCGETGVVLIGDSAWDFGVVSALIGKLGWTAVAGVIAAEAAEDGLHVTRRREGVSEVLQVTLPVVLGIVGTQTEKTVPGMKDILAARKKPLEKLSAGDLEVDAVCAVESRGTKFPDSPAAKLIDGADPEAASAELIAALHVEGVL